MGQVQPLVVLEKLSFFKTNWQENKNVCPMLTPDRCFSLPGVFIIASNVMLGIDRRIVSSVRNQFAGDRS